MIDPKTNPIFIQANARAIPLADGSVQTIVTSPPYWGLRSYMPDMVRLKSNASMGPRSFERGRIQHCAAGRARRY